MSDDSPEVAAYLSSLDDPVRVATATAWDAVRAAVPDATEAIAYDMPTLKLGGRNLVHVGGWATHVAVYPVPGDAELAPELERYRHGKSTLRLPLDEPMPVDLLGRVAAALAAARR